MKRMTYTVALALTSMAMVACDKPADQGQSYNSKYDGAALSSLYAKVDSAVITPRTRLSNEALDALKPTPATPTPAAEPAKDAPATDSTTPTPATPADNSPAN